MNSDELENLVTRGESETLEFKRSTAELVAGVRTATGMLNHGRGGHVLFGVTNRQRIAGMDISDSTMQRVSAAIQQIEPPGNLALELVETSAGKSVIVLVVPPSHVVHTYEGVSYQRIGRDTSRMPQEEYARRIVDQALSSDSWESRTASGFGVSDLDRAEIVRTVEDAIQRQRLSDPITRSIPELLMGLGLVDQTGQITNAAMILFGVPERLAIKYPQALLRMARFRGTTKNEFIDSRQATGNAFELIRRGQQFWIEHLPVAGRVISSQLERIDEPLYPTEALREALANALIHRDYSVMGGAVDLAIYDDRLELTSSGPLPRGISVDDLRTTHQSIRPNPVIAGVFFRRGLIETFGRGTLRMIELTRNAGLPEPEFEANRHSVTVRFLPSRYVAPSRVEFDLSELQQSILQVLGSGASLSLGQILESLPFGQVERTVQTNLQTLRSLGLLEMTGSRRWARWRLRRE